MFKRRLNVGTHVLDVLTVLRTLYAFVGLYGPLTNRPLTHTPPSRGAASKDRAQPLTRQPAARARRGTPAARARRRPSSTALQVRRRSPSSLLPPLVLPLPSTYRRQPAIAPGAAAQCSSSRCPCPQCRALAQQFSSRAIALALQFSSRRHCPPVLQPPPSSQCSSRADAAQCGCKPATV
jgi:hypothetical protein